MEDENIGNGTSHWRGVLTTPGYWKFPCVPPVPPVTGTPGAGDRVKMQWNASMPKRVQIGAARGAAV